MNWKILSFASALIIVGHTFIWFQCNSQFVWDWWKEHQIFSILIYALPAAFCFFYGWTYMVQEFNSLWVARLYGFALSFTIFPILTWHFMDESMFRPKVLICVVLAIIIMLIQVFYPEK